MKSYYPRTTRRGEIRLPLVIPWLSLASAMAFAVVVAGIVLLVA